MTNPPSASHPGYRLWRPHSPRYRNPTWAEQQAELSGKPKSWTAATAKKGRASKNAVSERLKREEAKLKVRPTRTQPKGKPVKQQGGYLLSVREVRCKAEQEQIAATKRIKKKPARP